jgi:hypothetical protein
MPAKRRSTSAPTKGRTRKRPKVLYPSQAPGPSPAERRLEVLKRMRQRGLAPIDDFDRYLDEVGDFWPKDETCDEFLIWLRRLRREGRS